MGKRTRINIANNPLWNDVNGACAMFSVGRSTMRSLAEKAGAVRKVGTRVLINTEKVNLYLDSLEQEAVK